MERKNDPRLLKICFAAMFAALICVATMIIRIPSPLGGYINFGDAFIIIAAWFLGPFYGFAAGGIGSALADLFSGYPVYIPGTFIIKGLMAVIAAIAQKKLSQGVLKKASHTMAAFYAEILMIVGYYLYAATVLSEGFYGALQSIPGNAVQGALGIVGSVVIISVMQKTKVFSKYKFYTI